MRLKLTELQRLVDHTIDEEKATIALKTEISRVLGPVVVVEGKFHDVIAAANDRLDVLTRTGRLGALEWDATVGSRWLDHEDPEVRKFAARIVPEQHLKRMTSDRSPEVRAAVAGRLSLNSVRDMVKRFPHDDMLRGIFKEKRRLSEAGVAQPKKEPMGIDPVDGAQRLGDAVRTAPGPELSEAWYHEQAHKFIVEYGQNIEYAWEEIAVHRFCSSMKATNGVEIDEAKLYKSIKKLIKEKEDMALERNSLKETLDWLSQQEEQELLEEGIIPDCQEPVDPVTEVATSHLTDEQLIEAVSQLFRVQRSVLPLGIRKYRLGEGNARQTLVPVIGMLPHQNGFRAIDERVLDMFCEAWSNRQQLAGEPLRLEWTNHPTDVNKVGFTVVLK